MKITILVLFFCACHVSSLNGYSQTATILLKEPESKTMINKNIYGHFAEHLGHCIYDGLYVGDPTG